MRLIDADKLREDWLQNGQNEYVYDTNAFLKSIDNAPTVDAVRYFMFVFVMWITDRMDRIKGD